MQAAINTRGSLTDPIPASPITPIEAPASMLYAMRVRNMVHVVLYGADKAVIVYIVHSELYRIIILNNNYNYHSIDITASALYS
jgi:hypothetical protein